MSPRCLILDVDIQGNDNASGDQLVRLPGACVLEMGQAGNVTPGQLAEFKALMDTYNKTVTEELPALFLSFQIFDTLGDQCEF